MYAQRAFSLTVCALIAIVVSASIPAQLPPSVLVAAPRSEGEGWLAAGPSEWWVARPGSTPSPQIHRISIAQGSLRYVGPGSEPGTSPFHYRALPTATGWRLTTRFRVAATAAPAPHLSILIKDQAPSCAAQPIPLGIVTTSTQHLAIALPGGTVKSTNQLLLSDTWMTAELSNEDGATELRVWDDEQTRPPSPQAMGEGLGIGSYVVVTTPDQEPYDVSIDFIRWESLSEGDVVLLLDEQFDTRPFVHPLPGSGSDFTMVVTTGVTSSLQPGVIFIEPGAPLLINLTSPTGIYSGGSVLFASAPLSPTAPLSNSPIPGAHLPVYTSTSSDLPTSPLGPPLLTTEGTSILLTIPTTAAGTRIRLQAYVCAADESILACADALEVVVVATGAVELN